MKKEKLFILILMLISFLAQSQVQLYFNSFEASSSFYTDSTNTIWEKGDPQKTVIDTTHSGLNIWITDLDSAYQGSQECHIYSPKIIIAPFGSLLIWTLHLLTVKIFAPYHIE